MIAVDTNILVYAHREDSSFHEVAFPRLTALAEGRAAWAIPWPCLHEFLAIVTHPRIYAPPTPTPAALAQVDAWLESPSLVLLAEAANHWPVLRDLVARAKVTGPVVHDARIAALCQEHGVRELWSADRDFGRFPDLRVVNPLIADAPATPSPGGSAT
ncbi:MAG TPA: TA system VapC family ribonuclease toxin [Caulobacteraceae bacterium]